MYTPVLERLLVVQVESFPQYSEKMQSACCRSILKVLVAMASKGPLMWGFISSVGAARRLCFLLPGCWSQILTLACLSLLTTPSHFSVAGLGEWEQTSVVLCHDFVFALLSVYQGLIRVCSKPIVLEVSWVTLGSCRRVFRP